MAALKSANFATPDELIAFVVTAGITQGNIQQIINKDNRWYIYYWI